MAIDPISLEIAKVVIKTVWEGGGKVVSWMGEKLTDKTKNLIFTASDRYWQNYQNRHCLLKVLGMREPVPLESIYTEVQFLSDRDICNFDSPDSLEQAFRESATRSYERQNSSRRSGLKAAKAKQYLMLLGSPGSGKSTFLRRIGLEALKGSQGTYQHDCIPVLVELKRFNTNETTLEKFIIEEFKTCGFPKAEDQTQELLRQGKLLILLDGLDEISSTNLNSAITQIQDFVDTHHQNRFIISCRTAAYRSGFRRFSDITIAEFNDAQIENFINNWFSSEADREVGTAKKCWEILQKEENKAAKELAQTPLLLTFLCLTYDRTQNFPDNRSTLYRKALRILLEEWASEKRILRDEIYSGLHIDLEETLLSEIAYKGFQSDKLFFAEQEIIQDIKIFLAGNLNAPQHLDGRAVLDAIAIQQGILVERAEDIYSFSHLTFQEYLTAQYIVNNNQTEQLATQHLAEKRWKEVFLLVAGLILMKHGADDLLLAIEKQAQSFIISPKLKALLNWAEQVTTDSESKLKPVSKRGIANAIAKAIANAIANANTIANAYDAPSQLTLIYSRNSYIDNAINTIANNIANASSITIALSIVQGVDVFTLGNVFAYATVSSIAIANVIAKAEYIIADMPHRHTYDRIVDKLKIFKNINFTAQTDRLRVLKTKAPDNNQPLQVRQEFANELLQAYLQAFNLDREMITLSEQELEAWDNYLYANLLIIQCKQAAARVSPQTWAEIEDRMLLPLPD